MDSGANEVLRPGEPPPRSRTTELQLANGETIDAYRSREGELVIPGSEPSMDCWHVLNL